MRKTTGSYRTYSIPGKPAALVPEFAVEDLPSAELQSRFVRLQWRTCPWAEYSVDDDDDDDGHDDVEDKPSFNCVYRVSLNSLYRLSGLVVGSSMVKLSIGTHVRKHIVSPLQTKYHHITCWTLPLLLLTVRCFSSGSTYNKGSMWRTATSTNTFVHHVESQEYLLARVTSGIGDPVFQNIVRRYSWCTI